MMITFAQVRIYCAWYIYDCLSNSNTNVIIFQELDSLLIGRSLPLNVYL